MQVEDAKHETGATIAASEGPEIALGVDSPAGGLGWLAVVLIGFVALAAWVHRRFGISGRGDGRAALKMVASLPLGEKRAIVMVEADEARLLVGVTPQNVQLLSRLPATNDAAAATENAPDAGEADDEASSAPEVEARGGFGSFLSTALARGRR